MPTTRLECNWKPDRHATVLRSLLWGAIVLGALSLGRSPVSASDEPTPETVAKALQTALGAKDDKALAGLAAVNNPDPWLVAEVLLDSGKADLAARIPALAPRKEVERLGAYIEVRKKTPVTAKRRDALTAALRAIASQPAQALEVVASSPTDAGDVVAVRTLFVRGRALQALRRHADAASAYDACARAAVKLGWLGRASMAFEQAARSTFRRSDFVGALRLAGDWRAVEAALGSKQGQARIACLMGLFHARLGTLDKTSALSKQALSILDPLGDHPYVALALSNLGYVEYARGRLAPGRVLYEQAVRHLEKPLPRTKIARFAPDVKLNTQQRIALMTSAAAFTYFLGEHDDAWKRLDAAAKAAEDAGEPELRARARLTAGALRQSAGDLLDALENFDVAVASYAQAGDRAGRAGVLRRIGTVRHGLGDYPAALASLGEALDVLVETGAAREAVLTHLAMSRAHMANGEPQQALAVCVLAQSAADKLGTTPLTADALRHMGDAHVILGEYALALERHSQALEHQRGAKNTDGMIRSLTDVGHMHTLLAATDKALETYDQALDLLDQSKSFALKAAVHLGIAKAKLTAGDDEGVEEALTQAHTSFTQARDPRGAAAALAAAVAWHRGRQAFAVAIQQADQLALAYEKLKNHTGLAMARLNKALSLQALGRSDEGLAVMGQALSAAHEASSVAAVVQCLWGLARLHGERGEHSKAMDAAEAGLAAMNKLGRHLAEGEGATARAQFAPLFDIGAAAAMHAKDAAKLYYFLESGRSATLLAALGGRDALRSSVIPADLRKEEAEARAAEAMALARLRRAQSRRRLREIRTQRKVWMAASARVQKVIERIQRKAREQANLVYPTVEPLDQVRAGLADDEALCLFGLTEARAVALVATKQEARIVDLGPKAAVTDACETLLLGAKPYIEESELRAVRKLLAEPLRLPPGVVRVLVSPDGITAYLPFSLLLQGREVVYVPSASVYKRLRGEGKLRGQRVLALGDPAYGKRAKVRKGAAQGKQRSGERAGGGRAGKLARLAATRDEAKAIGDDVLLGEQASETELRKALADDVRRRAVHLACHGLIDPQNPTLSSLALTADGENDGFLTALDVFRIPIRADLATLSACETGKGRVVRGEGIVGLTRAFLFAGSPRVIVSLWKVDDEATQALMVKFYELWNPKKGGGLPAATALRKAQAHVRAQEKWKHPYYWAAWVLWGLP